MFDTCSHKIGQYTQKMENLLFRVLTGRDNIWHILLIS